MGSNDLAKHLSDPKRLGLTEELAAKLKVMDEDVTHARLRAQASDGRAHVAIHLLGAWVKDCRDAVGKGEVYWWSIPMLGGADRKIRWNALVGLPTGAAPVAVGDRSWMTSISLKDPPILAVAPPDEDVAACIVRIGFYEDDWAPAILGPALTAGMTALADAALPAADVDGFVKPVREPIWQSLKAKQDDFMLEQDAKFLREEGLGYGAGLVTAMLTEYIRVYLFARDVERTEVAGPFALGKGQEQRVFFPSSLEGGGRLVVFSRGKARVDPFGSLDVDTPYVATVLDERQASALAKGITVHGEEDAEVIAYYTPPRAE